MSERTWTNPRYDIYQEQGPVVEEKGMAMRDAFELCGRGTWGKFQAFLEAKGIRQGALFIKGEESIMEQILLFFREHKQVATKYQALCLAAASKHVHDPPPFPDEINPAAKSRLNVETQHLDDYSTRIASAVKTLDTTFNKSHHGEVLKECRYQLRLTQQCLDTLSSGGDQKNCASGDFMKTAKSMEGMMKKASQDIETAAEQFEMSVGIFSDAIRSLGKWLPHRRKVLLLYKIAMGADHDCADEDWKSMGITATDFDRLGTYRFKKGITKKSPTIKNARFPSIDLTRANLRGLTFSECDMSKVKLSDDLRDITFKYCTFGDSFSCKDRNLTNTSFEGCALSGVCFEGAILKKTAFIFSKLAGCDFRKLSFFEVDMRQCNMEGAVLEDCDLSDSLLHKANLEQCSLKGISAPKRLDECKLGGAILDGVNLKHTTIRGADLKGASLRNCFLPDYTDFRTFDLHGTDLSSSVVCNANFDKCDLSNTVLDSIAVTDCSFVGSTLPEDVKWAVTTGSKFEDAERAAEVTAAALTRRNRVAAARTHAVAVTKEGHVMMLKYSSSFPIIPRVNAAEVAATDDYCMALLEDGTVQVWNERGMEVDIGLEAWTDVVAIRGGRNQIVGVRKGGGVLVWQGGESGCAPRELPRVAKVAVGGEHCLALLFNGGVVGWGGNDHGQRTIPEFGDKVVSIAAGAWHSVAVLESGKVFAWGLDTSGQATPPAVFNAVEAACGTEHSVVLTGNSTIIAWGQNTVGQIPYSVPRNVASIAAGSYFTLALYFDGTVQVWGATDEGDISHKFPSFARLP